jgi:TPR repeat protein
MFHIGQGVAKDYAEAVRLYCLAVAQGYASAQFNLGIMFENGRGVVQDMSEAIRLYHLAAAQGHAKATAAFMRLGGDGRAAECVAHVAAACAPCCEAAAK